MSVETRDPPLPAKAFVAGPNAVTAAHRAVRAAEELERLDAQRIAAVLNRLEDLYEPIRRRRDLLDVGLARINGLRTTMLAQLDAIDGDTDFEPSISALTPDERVGVSQLNWISGPDDDREFDLGEKEPSLCGVTCSPEHARSGITDGEDEHDGREPDETDDDTESESSLCGITFGHGNYHDYEGEHDGREPEEDDDTETEASLCGVTFGAPSAMFGFAPHDGEADVESEGEPSLVSLNRDPGDQRGSRWIGGVTSDDREGEDTDSEMENGV